MTAKRVAPGIYKDDRGKFWERPWNGRTTSWRRLYSLTLTDAKRELATKRSDHHRAKLGLAVDPYAPNPLFVEVLNGYNSDLRKRVSPASARLVALRVSRMVKFFGSVRANAMSDETARAYLATVPGAQTQRKDASILRQASAWSATSGLCQRNPLAGLKAEAKAAPVSHSREKMPKSGEELHAIARFLFRRPLSETAGWQVLISAMTGLRCSEVTRLRVDARPGEPGHVANKQLALARSKSGVNPFVVIHPSLQECLTAHRAWLALRFPGSPWYFPRPRWPQEPTPPHSLTKALLSASAALGIGKRTAHGLRAFYVTVRRCQGISDGQIAAEIGDRTGPEIIARVYGGIPPSWAGSAHLSFMADPPAWQSIPQTTRDGAQEKT